MIEHWVDILLLAFLAVIAVAVIRVRNLFAVVMLLGIYSLLSAGLFVVLNALDVALTEAAVGAGIVTFLMLGTLALVGSGQSAPRHRSGLPLLVVAVTGGALVYGTLDMPRFGDPEAPIHEYVAPRYLEVMPREVGIPNAVTAVLASYRGFDTLGEVVVIFTAGIGVLILLGLPGREEEDP